MPSRAQKSRRRSISTPISARFWSKTVAKLQEEAGVAAPLCLGAGEVSHVVRDSALGHSADLVVIGRGRATHTLGRLRSHVYSIIRDAPCPVISV
jgi:nucleotide-binding universal stress UspA family protein